MSGLYGTNEAFGMLMLEYDKYVAKCNKEGVKPLGFFKFMTGSFKGTI